jgi:dipeptidase
MKRITILIIATVLCSGYALQACTNFLVTKGASTDGSSMVSYAADSHRLYGELYHWKAGKHHEGTMLKVIDWDSGKYLGEIKEAPETYNVVGNMNEHQLVIGETTYGGRKELGKQEGAIIDYGSLIYITLQRAKSAREAIKIMTDLVAEYGYASSGESFSIADPNEVWIMEMIGKGNGHKGAVWVALQVPDGYVCAHANQARITTFKYQKKNKWFDKTQTVFNSKDIISFAKEKGWYKNTKEPFSFSDTYAPVDFGAARFCEMRVWAFFNEVTEGMDKYWDYAKGDIHTEGDNHYATNRMPLFVKPTNKISLKNVMDYMRDHLEGTELDMSKDVGAGPYGNPYRWRPLTWKNVNEKGDTLKYCNERATATQQTAFSFVGQCRSWLPNTIGGIIWFGLDDAGTTVYTPMYSSITAVPKSYEKGNGSLAEFKFDAAFWVYNLVSNLAYTRYNAIYADIKVVQDKMENGFIDYVLKVDKEAKDAYTKSPAKAIQFLTGYSTSVGDQTTAEWLKFYQYLFTKYMDGNIKTPDDKGGFEHDEGGIIKLTQPGYGSEWYNKIVKETGDQFKMGKSGH